MRRCKCYSKEILCTLGCRCKSCTNTEVKQADASSQVHNEGDHQNDDLGTPDQDDRAEDTDEANEPEEESNGDSSGCESA